MDVDIEDNYKIGELWIKDAFDTSLRTGLYYLRDTNDGIPYYYDENIVYYDNDGNPITYKILISIKKE